MAKTEHSVQIMQRRFSGQSDHRFSLTNGSYQKGNIMSKEEDNKAIVGRWFTEFWGETCNLDIVDELAAPDMRLQYSLHAPRRGHADIKAFMSGFREAFPDLNFWGAAELIAEGDYVVGRWEGGGTHTGPTYQKRLQRYRHSLFTLLEYDGIPWNNNMAERAIRHLAVQRKISGTFFASVAPQYLLLLGLAQTCRFQGKSVLKFLLSGEKDIDSFKGAKRVRSLIIAVGKPVRGAEDQA